MTAASGAAMGVLTTGVPPNRSDWRAAHEALTRLARTRAGLDFEEGQQLRTAQRARVHERLGYGSFVEYIERLFGYAPRLTPNGPETAEMARCDAQNLSRSGSSGARSRRASQTIPPAVRRTVLQRDHHRCQVPGCRHATFVDVHHLRARSDGGNHDAENLLTLCGAHHRACHRGDLLIARGSEGDLEFRHADGTIYGKALSAGVIDATARALQALRNLGFGEREARDALHEACAHVGMGKNETGSTDHAQVEALIRGALELLTRNSWAKAS